MVSIWVILGSVLVAVQICWTTESIVRNKTEERIELARQARLAEAEKRGELIVEDNEGILFRVLDDKALNDKDLFKGFGDND